MRSKSWVSILFGAALALVFLFQACSAASTSSITNDSLDAMAKEHVTDRPVPTELALAEPKQAIVTEWVNYATVDGTPVKGYLAKPEASVEGLPGVIAIHEWWGVNENIQKTAERLAGEGYIVLAVDLYAGEVTDQRDRARQLVGSVMDNVSSAQDNLKQAYMYLSEDQQAPTVGTIGWCFGGAWSLQTALLLPEDIDATVIYYGRLVTDAEQLKPLKMPILGLFGAEDGSIPVATVQDFEKALQDTGKSAEIKIYEGAGHAFANPSGTRYVPEVAEDAWNRTLKFFETNLLVR